MKEQEIWKEVPGYEGDYMVSDQGRVKSLKFNKERILKLGMNSTGYYMVVLCKNKKTKSINVHQLVSIVFLGHKPDGTNKIVVDHINEDRLDNRTSNLQLITNRQNNVKSILLNKNLSSRYVGVCFCKNTKKWQAAIQINKKPIKLGLFDYELFASEIYNKALELMDQYDGDNKKFRELVKLSI